MPYQMDQENGEEPQWSHLLVSDGYLDEVQQPIMASSRIKYTCISVSKRFIALGSSTGVVHIFLRDSLKYVQLIGGDKDGSVVKIAIGPDESTVAFATSKGMVYVYLMKMDRRMKPEKLRSTNDHRGATVTSLVWNDQGNRLFTGDNFGKVTAANIVVGAKDLFKAPSMIIMRLDKPVVQIDSFNDLMLVSTTDRTYIGNSSKQQYTHIGSKLRDGHFGACFWRPLTTGGESMIYCSRPGSRMWESTVGGRVLNTHQFKALLAVPSLPLVQLKSEANYESPAPECSPQSITFPQLLVLGNRFLVTMNECGLYIFDPVEVKVVLWNEELKNSADWSCYQTMIYILHEDGRIQKVDLIQIGKVVSKLVKQERWKLAAELCLAYESTIRNAASRHHVPVAMTTKIAEQLEKEGLQDLASGIRELVPKLEDFLLPDSQTSSSQSSRRSSASYEMTESGIYIVKNKADSPPFYSQNVFSFWNQAEKYLDKAFVGREEAVSTTSSNDASNLHPSSGSNGNIYLETPQEHLNGSFMAPDCDVIDAASLADEEASALESLAEGRNDTPTVQIAREAETIEDVAENEKPVIFQRSTCRPKSKGRKLKTTRVIELEDENKTVPEDAEKVSSPSVNVNNTLSDLPQSDKNAVTDTGESSRDNESAKLLSNGTKNDETDSTGKSQFPALYVASEDSSPVAMASGERRNLLEATAMVTGEESPRHGILGVKDKLSGTVKTKTKSLIQTIKDKKSQISPRLRHKSVEDLGALVFHKDGDNSNYFIQAQKKDHVDPTKETEHDGSSFAYNIEEVTMDTFQCLKNLSNVCAEERIKQLLLAWVKVLQGTLLYHRKRQSVSKEENVVPLTLSNGVELVIDLSKNNLESDEGEKDDSEKENDKNTSENDVSVVFKDNGGNDNQLQLTSDDDCVVGTDNFNVDNNHANQEVDSSTDIQPTEDVVVSLEDSTAIPMTQELKARVSELACFCFELETYGDIQSLAINSGVKMSDTELFLRTFYYLVEPHLTRIWKGLQKKGKLGPKWLSLFACVKDAVKANEMMLQLSESDPEETIEVMKPSLHQMGPELLVYLEKLYEKNPSVMVNFAAQHARNLVLLSEVKHIIDSHPDAQKGRHLCEYFESYVSGEYAEQRLQRLRHILDEAGLSSTWFETLLVEMAPEGAAMTLKCSCGMPSPKSHCGTWKSEDLMLEILSSCQKSLDLLELCYKHGFWKGYLKLQSLGHSTQSSKDRSHILSVILQLDDLELFQHYHELQPHTQEEWKSLLTLLRLMNRDETEERWMCLLCKTNLKPCFNQSSSKEVDLSSVTWENVCNRILDDLGPEATLELLSDSRSFQGQLSVEFYTKCVTSAHLNVQQRQIVQEIIDKLQTSTPAKHSQVSLQVPICEERDTSGVERAYSGVHSDDNKNCGICGLDIRKPIINLSSKINSFHCGHAFHNCCVQPGENCPACH